jgi:hypothetical protein
LPSKLRSWVPATRGYARKEADTAGKLAKTITGVVIWAQQLEDAKNRTSAASNLTSSGNAVYWLKQLEAAKKEKADVLEWNWRKD